MTFSASGFQPYAVASRTGPHVTMQAGIEYAGRFWTTTARSSLKSRSVAAHGHASALVHDGDRCRIVSGRTVALRPLRPWTSLRDPVAGALWGAAVARLSRSHVGQLFGYLEAAGEVPKEWFPVHRALLVTRIDRSLDLDGVGIEDRTGTWATIRAIDLSSSVESRASRALPVSDLPATHRPVVNPAAPVHVGVSTPTGPVPLPATWAGDDRFHVSLDALVAVEADVHGRGSVVFDRSDRRRPDEKLGVMFRGSVDLVDIDGESATLALTTERVTTWDGFSASTIDVEVAVAA